MLLSSSITQVDHNVALMLTTWCFSPYSSSHPRCTTRVMMMMQWCPFRYAMPRFEHGRKVISGRLCRALAFLLASIASLNVMKFCGDWWAFRELSGQCQTRTYFLPLLRKLWNHSWGEIFPNLVVIKWKSYLFPERVPGSKWWVFSPSLYFWADVCRCNELHLMLLLWCGVTLGNRNWLFVDIWMLEELNVSMKT